jgi:hypothetical protein
MSCYYYQATASFLLGGFVTGRSLERILAEHAKPCAKDFIAPLKTHCQVWLLLLKDGPSIKNDTPVHFNVKNVTFATNYGQNSTQGAQL